MNSGQTPLLENLWPCQVVHTGLRKTRKKSKNLRFRVFKSFHMHMWNAQSTNRTQPCHSFCIQRETDAGSELAGVTDNSMKKSAEEEPEWKFAKSTDEVRLA